MLRVSPKWQRLFQKSLTGRKLGLASDVAKKKHLPPALPGKPLLIDPTSLWEQLPVTKYWGMENRDRVLREAGITCDLHPPLIPRWYRKFDWVVGYSWGFADERKAPKTILCNSNSLNAFIEWARYSSGKLGFSNATLAVMGNDDTISQLDSPTVDLAFELFHSVYFSANDGTRPLARTVPMALTEHYVRGFEKELRLLVSNPLPQKTELLLASFGKHWPSLNTMDDRAQASEVLSSSGLTEVRVLSRKDYFDAISKSHYFLYPRGNGIQSPKGFEALLLGCIPIVTRHPAFEELERRGMPLLIIENWRQLSTDLLESHLDEMSRRVTAFLPNTRSADRWWDFCFPSTVQ